jgi:hypothetical protein
VGGHHERIDVHQTGTDAKTGSVASADNATATAGPGDTLKWVLHYNNTTGSSATVNITDPGGRNQSFVPRTNCSVRGCSLLGPVRLLGSRKAR